MKLDFFKQKLEKKKEEFYNNYENNQNLAKGDEKEVSGDLVDQATDDYAKEFLNYLSKSDLNTLEMIDEALERIKEDDYGICLDCDEDISEKRLKAVPWARYCLDCQEKREKEEE